ncbi:MAG: UDP-N-acetylmuramyl-tripeptide synthetase [Coriobacteriales bacterium]|jgi:UDP-N-acetylmuramoyl-L-alanyl-D-glutamate--2,6-diaminopimelate ligase|nr:UDP-N-acetylmuramyl-tripeptide synthetase [Coriobacteriales bacterium]
MHWTPQTTTLASCARLLLAQGNLVAAPEGSEGSEARVTQLSYDSRTVEPGALFFCKGAHFKPEYLAEAVKAGAQAYVSEHSYAEYLRSLGARPIPVLLVRQIQPAIADLAALWYRGLLERLTLIGFTGTKGKTTTTYMLRAILDSWLGEQGRAPSAWLSSIENYDGVARTRSLLTTPDVLELYAHFRNAVDSAMEYLVMEVSSQALKYHRTRGLSFEVVGFLNIGEDHVSPVEHASHEDYLASKLELFKQGNTAVVNLESDELERVLRAAEASKRVLSFGLAEAGEPGSTEASEPEPGAEAGCTPVEIGGQCPIPGHARPATLVASEVESTARGLSFVARTQHWQERFTLPMAGRFNVENALAALTAALALGVPVEHMQNGLATCEVSGRMQLMAGPDDKLIIVDYAHNRMSFEAIFSTVASEYPGRPIICVFGATGGKGSERRVDLPAVAVGYAEKIYITEDDPGEEPLARINQQIAEVVAAAGVAHDIIEDRDAAIAHAIREAPAHSVVLILGKGHETLMKRGREAQPVPSDAERVRRLLAEG